MERRQGMKGRGLHRPFSSSVLFCALAACNVDPTGAVGTAPLVAPGTEWVLQPQRLRDVSGGKDAKTVQLDIQEELSLRKKEYDAVVDKAQRRGLVGGAIQGSLLGILITGSAEGMVVGGITGGAVGHWVSGQAATQIVEEHRNFLIRKWSIETVLKAASEDTENTRFDLLLSKRALEASRSQAHGAATIGDQGVMHLFEFRERAEGRALVLNEMITVFSDDPVASRQLSELLKKQIEMLGAMQRNVDEIAKRHE
jgi:hypothetical protein